MNILFMTPNQLVGYSEYIVHDSKSTGESSCLQQPRGLCVTNPHSQLRKPGFTSCAVVSNLEQIFFNLYYSISLSYMN